MKCTLPMEKVQIITDETMIMNRYIICTNHYSNKQFTKMKDINDKYKWCFLAKTMYFFITFGKLLT